MADSTFRKTFRSAPEWTYKIQSTPDAVASSVPASSNSVKVTSASLRRDTVARSNTFPSAKKSGCLSDTVPRMSKRTSTASETLWFIPCSSAARHELVVICTS